MENIIVERYINISYNYLTVNMYYSLYCNSVMYLLIVWKKCLNSISNIIHILFLCSYFSPIL